METQIFDIEFIIQPRNKNPQNLNDIDKMQNYLDNFDNVKTTISVNDVVKQLHKVIEGNNNEYYSVPETRQKISNLFTMYEWNEDMCILICRYKY